MHRSHHDETSDLLLSHFVYSLLKNTRIFATTRTIASLVSYCSQDLLANTANKEMPARLMELTQQNHDRHLLHINHDSRRLFHINRSRKVVSHRIPPKTFQYNLAGTSSPSLSIHLGGPRATPIKGWLQRRNQRRGQVTFEGGGKQIKATKPQLG